MTRHYRFRCVDCSAHSFGPVELRSGDLFGLATCTVMVEHRRSVLVLPRVVPIEALGLPTRFPLGNDRTHDPHMVDPIRFSGC